MNEIDKVLARLQDVAPVVVEAVRRQLWIDFWMSLVMTLVLAGLSRYFWVKYRDTPTPWGADKWGLAATLTAILAIVIGIFWISTIGEVLNPDYAVYRRLMR